MARRRLITPIMSERHAVLYFLCMIWVAAQPMQLPMSHNQRLVDWFSGKADIIIRKTIVSENMQESAAIIILDASFLKVTDLKFLLFMWLS